MRQFLRRISIFVTAVLLFFVLWRVVLYVAKTRIGNKVTHSATVFVGDSRMNYLYQSADNYGVTAEPLVYSYYKLKYILSQRNLDTVVLAVGYNSFSSHYDDHINNVRIIERYYPYLPQSMQSAYLMKVQHPRILYDRTVDLLTKGTIVMGSYDAPPRNWHFSESECDKRLKEQYDGYSACPIPTQYGKLMLAEFDYSNTPKMTFPFDQTVPRWSMWLLKKYVLPWLYWNRILTGKA